MVKRKRFRMVYTYGIFSADKKHLFKVVPARNKKEVLDYGNIRAILHPRKAYRFERL